MDRLQQQQLDLFAPVIAQAGRYDVATTPEVEQWLLEGAVCALGISGGKDSQAMAIRMDEYLKSIGHKGPRILIHSDLGVVEWKDSLPVCERLAKRLGWDLIVLRRSAGDMMDRWEARWASSLERYSTLSCVKIILPWSTPGMRFCTSELKTDLICRELTKRYPGQKILSATGVRHDESAARSKMPIASPQPKLSARGCQGMNWNPIAPWSTPSVYEYIALKQEPLHEAYTVYNSTRVSCAFCIMGSAGDLKASASCPDNADIYRRMVRLEIASTFGLQGARWLGDVAPHLLSEEERQGLALAKQRAERRVRAESRLPAHLLYTAGWPTCEPTLEEAQLIAEVRLEVAEILGITVQYTTAEDIVARYQELCAVSQTKRAAKARTKKAADPVCDPMGCHMAEAAALCQ